MKKALIIIIAIAILLTACDGSPAEQPGTVEAPVLEERGLARTLTISRWTTDFQSIEKEQLLKDQFPDVELIVHEYHMDYEKYNTQMNTAIMSGNAGDLIEVTASNMYHYGKSGYFADIYTLMDADPGYRRDDYYENVFQALSVDGKLMSYAAMFYIQFWAEHRAFMDHMTPSMADMKTVSHQDLLEMYNSIDPSRREGYYLGKNFDMNKLIYYSKFVDFPAKSCNLNTPEFTALLEGALIATDPDKQFFTMYSFSEEADEWPYVFAELGLFQAQFMLPPVEPFISQDFYPSLSYTNPRPMATEQGEVYAHFVDHYAIMETSENKDLAWKYLKNLDETSMDYNYYYHINKERSREQVRLIFDNYLRYAKLEATPEVQGHVDELLEWLMDCGEYPLANMTASTDIPGVQEVMAAFFEGRLTAAQAAENLQNVITLFFME